MSLLFGWSERNLTPDRKFALMGQYAERISTYVEKPLTATAMAVDSGTDQMVLVSCDLNNVHYNLLQAIRSHLAGNTIGLDPQKVIYACIHTHTGPLYPRKPIGRPSGIGTGQIRPLLQELLPPGKKYIERIKISDNSEIMTQDEMFDHLAKELALVALEAWEDRKPGSFATGFGRAPIGLCRRIVFSDGTAQMWGESNTAVFDRVEYGSDSGIETMFVYDEEKKLKGIVATIACPAQCVQHRHFVSPDYWGEAKKLLREHFGPDLYLVALCSIAGDQCPVDLVRWVEPESDLNDPNCTHVRPLKRKADPSMFDLSGMRKAGKRAARGIIEAWEDTLGEPQTDPVFEHRSLQLELPLRRATLTDVANAKAAIRDYIDSKDGDLNWLDAGRLQNPIGTLYRAKIQEIYNTVETEVHIIRMGTIAIATNPFEPYLAYGEQIKARSLAEQTFLVELANGGDMYIPTKEAEAGGHYSAYIAGGVVGHQGGEQLVRETLKHINQMFSE